MPESYKLLYWFASILILEESWNKLIVRIVIWMIWCIVAKIHEVRATPYLFIEIFCGNPVTQGV